MGHARHTKLKEAAKIFIGACTVYAIVAACGDAYTSNGPGSDSGSANDSTSDGFNAILDAIEQPEKEAQADDFVSGTRLKANRYTGADGSRQFVGWHDSLLGVDCAFSVADDGATRCLPTGPSYQDFFYYSDVGCKTPLVTIDTGCAAPKYIVEPDGEVCGAARSKIVAIVGTKFTGTGVYVAGPGGPASCSTSTTTPPAGQDLYPVGATIDPSQFVQATVATDP